MTASTVGAIVVIALAVVGLAAHEVSHVRCVRRERRALLTGVESLFERVRITQDGIGYPVLTGVRHGMRVKVELLADSMALRQLPRLWLLVSILRPVRIAAPVDVLLQPEPTDIVSPAERFPYEHAAPVGWPGHVRIATPSPTPPDLDAFDAVVGLLHQPGTKDVLVGPGGVRIVQELTRGEVGQWRLVRRPKFIAAPPRERVADLVDAALRLAARFDTPSRVVAAPRS
jgi:hypothetical protein